MSTGNRIAGYHNREATVKDLQAHEVERMRKREDVEEEMLDICHPQTIPRRTESDTEDLLRDALAEIEHWMEHAKRTEARLGAVVKRHQPVPNDAGDEVCGTCGRYWPCGERRHFDSLGIPRAALVKEKPKRFASGMNEDDHLPTCAILTTRDGWDADCTCGGLGRVKEKP